LWKIGDLIEQHAETLAEIESLDNGKPKLQAQAVDVAASAEIFHYMAGWCTKLEGNTIQLSTPYAPGAVFHAYTLREPVGVVGQIVPWTFPLMMAAWKLAPALACANTVMLKPAEQTPLSALYLADLMHEAGLPTGVTNVVTGFGETAGAALAAHPGVDKIAFATCPWLKKIASAAPRMAASMSASANTMLGALPPSSRVTFFRFPRAASMMSLPTSWSWLPVCRRSRRR
jgi:phenylacetaldehyde dehydrogenase